MDNTNIKALYCRRPHTVIIGAGASRAVMGEICPTMNDAIKQVGLDESLIGVKLQTESKNLEEIYSELFRRGDECKNVRLNMEKALYNYFTEVNLPDTLTIYDQLILSLTKKDCILSFNWDSLLIQAYNRVKRITQNRPEMYFLHGNVGAGVCEDCMQFGPIQNYCRKCGKPLKPVPILYPVEQKDYNSNIFIRDQWIAAKDYIARAGEVTIFGYSAPSSDREASDILKSAFSQNEIGHKYDTVEIIERPGFKQEDISDTWKYFFSVVSNKKQIINSFYDSDLAIAPRRTLQYNFKRIEGWWDIPKISFSKNDTFESVKKLLSPLLINEENGNYDVV